MIKLDFNNEALQKNSINILSAVVFITLFLPIITLKSSAYGVEAYSQSLNGLDMIGTDTITGIFVFVLTPFIMLCGERVDAIKKYMNVLCVIVPIISLLFVIQMLFFADAAAGAISAGGFMGIEMDSSISLGGFLLLLSCIGLFVQGAKKYGYTLDQAGIATFRENILEIVNGHR